jgi:hypothetical protein
MNIKLMGATLALTLLSADAVLGVEASQSVSAPGVQVNVYVNSPNANGSNSSDNPIGPDGGPLTPRYASCALPSNNPPNTYWCCTQYYASDGTTLLGEVQRFVPGGTHRVYSPAPNLPCSHYPY